MMADNASVEELVENRRWDLYLHLKTLDYKLSGNKEIRDEVGEAIEKTWKVMILVKPDYDAEY